MHSRGANRSKRSSVAKTTRRSNTAQLGRPTSSSIASFATISSRSVSNPRASLNTSSSSSRAVSTSQTPSRKTSSVQRRKMSTTSIRSSETLLSFSHSSPSPVFRASPPTQMKHGRPRHKVQGQLVDTEDPEHPYLIPTVKIPKLRDSESTTKYNPQDSFGLFEVGERRSPVTIFKPAKNAMENQKNDDFPWLIRNEDSGFAYTSQLTGADHVADNDYFPPFPTKEDAIDYCLRNNLQYYVQEDPIVVTETRSYADNFKWKGPPPVDH